jgi:hypothetical protein
LRADSRLIDYVNNIVYDYAYFWEEGGGYGIRIKNKWEPDEPPVTANIINNALIATRNFAEALMYGEAPGRDDNDLGPTSVLAQGTLYTASDMDSLYVSGNLLPAENMDQYSTVAAPLPIPESLQVTTFDASQLVDSVVPFVGTVFPLTDEQDIFSAITDSLQSHISGGVTGIPGEAVVPAFALNVLRIYSGNVEFRFSMGHPGNYRLEVTDVTGRNIWEYRSQGATASTHSVLWDRMNLANQPVQNGIYFVSLKQCAELLIKRFVLLRYE